MRKPFVLISGLPGSGKTTLGRRLVPRLDLPLIDKDDILERLFAERGTGDAAWRRALSRESDAILRREAMRSDGAILCSFWNVPGMPADSGTPTGWLDIPSHRIVHLQCVCGVQVAAERFRRRQRHPGHLDDQRSPEDILRSIRQVAQLPPPAIGSRIDVDTSRELDLAEVVHKIQHVLAPI